MSTTAVAGVVAAGRVPTWIFPIADLVAEPSGPGPWSIVLSAITGAVKVDCHMDAGDLQITRTPTTKQRQRLCQIVAETIKTGETIDLTLSAVFDQQKALTDAVNEVYAELPEGSEVYIAQAFGHDSSKPATAATVIDLYRGTVQSRMKTQPTSADEDLKFEATLSGSAYWADVTLTT